MPITKLSPSEETKFQDWYAQWAQKAGLNPNPDDPRHYYDYRAAYMAGAEPQIDPADGLLHWPSEFKLEGHPRLIVNGVNTKTGKRANTIRQYKDNMK